MGASDRNRNPLPHPVTFQKRKCRMTMPTLDAARSAGTWSRNQRTAPSSASEAYARSGTCRIDRMEPTSVSRSGWSRLGTSWMHASSSTQASKCVSMPWRSRHTCHPTLFSRSRCHVLPGSDLSSTPSSAPTCWAWCTTLMTAIAPDRIDRDDHLGCACTVGHSAAQRGLETLPVFMWKVFKIGLVLAFALQSGFYISERVRTPRDRIAMAWLTTFSRPAPIQRRSRLPYALPRRASTTGRASVQVLTSAKEAASCRLDLVLAAVVTAFGNGDLPVHRALFVMTLAQGCS